MFEEAMDALGLGKKSLKQLNLALQGGGAHGAYTWGVLDRLLEDEYLTIDAISGTSAGAVNAVALAQGFMEGGLPGARARLTAIWTDISKAGDFLRVPSFDSNPATMMTRAMIGMFSPYDTSPLAFDPLRDILKEHIDFEGLRENSVIGLHIAATRVATGQARIFKTDEISLETVLASSCLPIMGKAVTINGEHYWDGGFSANPALRPVIFDSNTDDTLLVQLSPMTDFDLHKHIPGVSNHVSQLSFSQSLSREIELIEEMRALTENNLNLNQKARNLSRHRFHLIDGTPATSRFNMGSEMTPNWSMLMDLFEKGREACTLFLEAHRSDIGHKASVDLADHFGL